MAPVITRHAPDPVQSIGRVAAPIVAAVALAAAFALLLGVVAPADTIDRISIENRTSTQLEVGVAGDDGAVLWLTAVAPRSTSAVNEVLDHDGEWVVRAEHAGRDVGVLRLTRDELRGRGWRIVLPARWEKRAARA